MDFIEKLKLIERIDSLISRKSTGTPAHLSQRVGVSERTLYNIIAIMKNLGAPIFYCNVRTSYCYTASVSFSYAYNIDEEQEENPTEKDNTQIEDDNNEMEHVDIEQEPRDMAKELKVMPDPQNSNIRKLTQATKPSQDPPPGKANEWASQKENRNLFFPRRTF